MQLLPRWLGSQKPAHEAELEQEVTRLQATLVRCRNAAGFWGRLRPPFKAAIVVLILAAGFVLGAYSGPLRQATSTCGRARASAAASASAAFAPISSRNTPPRSTWRGRWPRPATPAPAPCSGSSI